jgi:acyl carrier protein
MNRDEVMDLVREHLVNELELEPSQIVPKARFKEDFDADSLDLYELVMELEDQYGISVSQKEAGDIVTVEDAVEFVLAKTGS